MQPFFDSNCRGTPGRESMASVKALETSLRDSKLAAQLAKLWPHREHEAPAIAGISCRLGLHRWKRLDLTSLAPDRDILHCFRCSRVKMDGIVYDV